jgi:hypothetical protein
MNYNLSGSIPKEILGLKSLSSYLYLSYNSLSGPIPSEVGGLYNLNKLVLSRNHFFLVRYQPVLELYSVGILIAVYELF